MWKPLLCGICACLSLLLASCSEDSAANLDAFWIASGPARELYRLDRDSYETKVQGYLNSSLVSLSIDDDYQLYGIEAVTQYLVSIDAITQRTTRIRDLVEVTDARAICFNSYFCYVLDQGQRVLRINPESGLVLATWTLNRPHQDYIDITVARGAISNADVFPGDLLLLRRESAQSRIYRIRLEDGVGAVREICTTSSLCAFATTKESDKIYALSEDASALVELLLPEGNMNVIAYTDLDQLQNPSLTLP